MMTCNAISTVGCAGFEGFEPVLPYRHDSISTTVVPSLYTASDVPETQVSLDFPIEAQQVVIEAIRPSKAFHDFQDQHIPEQEPALSSITTATTSTSSSSQQVSYQDSVDYLGLMTLKKRVSIVIAAFIASIWGLDKLHDHLDPNSGWQGDEEKEEKAWIASSNSYFERGACRWLGVCGINHIAKDPAVGFPKSQNRKSKTAITDDNASPTILTQLSEDDWSFEESVETGKVLQDVPQYVLDHAPLVYLYSKEEFWPCDPSEHLLHTTAHLNYTPISPEHSTLRNLDQYNDLDDDGRFVFLKSDDNVEDRPDWLGGAGNIPAPPGAQNVGSSWTDWNDAIDGPRPDDDREAWYQVGIDSPLSLGGLRPEPDSSADDPIVPSQRPEGEELLHESEDTPVRRRRSKIHHKQPRKPHSSSSPGGYSSAPATLILVQKSPDIIDAFWFYFYSYNLGNTVFNVRFGNHVGDWEHSLIRFQNGIPRVIFFSEHSGGKAYTYSAVEKIGVRPVIYSAEGTHAMYATPGPHPYVLPAGLLKDVTDRGKLWDPALNLNSYHYNYTLDHGNHKTLHDSKEQIFQATSLTPQAPTNWFWFGGHWGDKFYELKDRRQYRFLGEYHYVNGPLGPRFKHLGRSGVCQGNGGCEVLEEIGGK